MTGVGRTSTPYPQAARVLLRDTILDAVDRLVRDRGWASTTMSDVASSAGISRQTVYNEFGSRAELAQTYVLREAERFIEEVSEAVRANQSDPHAAVTAAVEVFLHGAADEPIFKSIIFRDGEDSMLALLTTRGGPVVRLATTQLSGLIGEVWPSVSETDAGLLTEFIVRLGISHAALPTAPPDITARRIARVLGPFIDAAINTG